MDIETYALLKKKVDNVTLAYSYKGSVEDVASLPDDATIGDMYTVGKVQYVWDGTEWITPEYTASITNAKIDELYE